LDFLKNIAEKYVDIIFANEEEAKAFTGKNPTDALVEIAKISKIAIVKTGKKGSLIKSGELVYEISPVSANAIDTTGAGDLYAAGFIYGLISGLPLGKAGQIGSILASTVIGNVGAKIPDKSWPEIKKKIQVISSV
jgi:sugar/nucleoside kinase (ribokinase family)